MCKQTGWGPLCKFLNLPIPSVTFPHINDATMFQNVVQILDTVGFLIVAVGIAIISVGAYAIALAIGKHPSL